MGALRKEVRQGRAKLARGAAGDEAALRPHQTLLQWYLDSADVGKGQLAGEVQAGDSQRSDRSEESEQADERKQEQTDRDSSGAKRKKADAAPGNVEGTAAPSKLRRGVEQQPEPVSASPLTTTTNLWEALADG